MPYLSHSMENLIIIMLSQKGGQKKSTWCMIPFLQNSRKCKASYGGRKEINGCLGRWGREEQEAEPPKGNEETLGRWMSWLWCWYYWCKHRSKLIIFYTINYGVHGILLKSRSIYIKIQISRLSWKIRIFSSTGPKFPHGNKQLQPSSSQPYLLVCHRHNQFPVFLTCMLLSSFIIVLISTDTLVFEPCPIFVFLALS